MYGNSQAMIKALGTTNQTGKFAPNIRIELFKKTKDKETDTYNFNYQMGVPFFITNATSVDISRNGQTGSNSGTVTIFNPIGFYSPDYSSDKIFDNLQRPLPISSFRHVIVPYTLVHIYMGYGNELLRVFTGYIKKPKINEDEQSIKFDIVDEYYRLMKSIDTKNTQKLIYRNASASFVITDLLKRAGIKNFYLEVASIDDFDFSVNFLEVTLGDTYETPIKSILEIMFHTMKVNRFGILEIQPIYIPDISKRPDVTFSDTVNVTSGEYFFDDDIIRNKIIVQGANRWQAYEYPQLIDWFNGEIKLMAVDVPFVVDDKQFEFVANYYFLQMARKKRKLSIVTPGNPTLDIGDVALLQALISTANAKYQILSINTSYSVDGYSDTIELEFIEPNIKVAKPSDDEYRPIQEEVNEDGNIEVTIPEDEEKISIQQKVVNTTLLYAQGFVYYQANGNMYQVPDDYGFDSSHFVFACLHTNDVVNYYMTLSELFQKSKEVETDYMIGDIIFYLNENSSPVNAGIFIGDDRVCGMFGGSPDIITIGMAKIKNAKCQIVRLEGDFIVRRII